MIGDEPFQMKQKFPDIHMAVGPGPLSWHRAVMQ